MTSPTLIGRPFILGDELSAAEAQLSFIGELAAARFGISGYPNLEAWLKRFQARRRWRREAPTASPLGRPSGTAGQGRFLGGLGKYLARDLRQSGERRVSLERAAEQLFGIRLLNSRSPPWAGDLQTSSSNTTSR